MVEVHKLHSEVNMPHMPGQTNSTMYMIEKIVYIQRYCVSSKCDASDKFGKFIVIKMEC